MLGSFHFSVFIDKLGMQVPLIKLTCLIKFLGQTLSILSNGYKK